jgi:hypothetical protein
MSAPSPCRLAPPGAARQAFDREKPPRDGSAQPTDRSRKAQRRSHALPEDATVYEKTPEGQQREPGYEHPDPLDPTPSGDHRGDSTVGTDQHSGTD